MSYRIAYDRLRFNKTIPAIVRFFEHSERFQQVDRLVLQQEIPECSAGIDRTGAFRTHDKRVCRQLARLE